MSNSIFQEGRPLQGRRVGPDQHEFRISIPVDSDGMSGRECPNDRCSPGYFKVKPGTGITEGQTSAFCPYCRREGEPGDFATSAQKDYAIQLVQNEAINGINQSFERALGLGPSRKKKFGGDFISMEISFKPSRPEPVYPPLEEELRRDLVCSRCGLEHAVFGIATWCPDCGTDIFIEHVEQELVVVRKMVNAVDARRAAFGARVAARDLENALEDVVSIFETILKVMTRRYLLAQGGIEEEVEHLIEHSIRNSYQNVASAATTFQKYVDVELCSGFAEDDITFLRSTFEKRHPIAHNLGIIDRKYLERVRSGESTGREIRITATDVLRAITITSAIIARTYAKVFGPNNSSLGQVTAK